MIYRTPYPSPVRIFLQILTSLKFLFLTFFFITGCSNSTQNQSHNFSFLSEEERTNLEHLFNYLFFENHGAFVLFGSKPLCEAQIFPKIDRNQEIKLWDQLPEEVKKNASLEECEYDLKACWETWERVKKHFKINNYLIVEWPFAQNPNCCWVYIVNIQKMAITLSENYSIFREIAGEDFNPLEAVFEIENIESAIWNKWFSHHLTKGLLFGFGKNNSFFFDFMMKKPQGRAGEYLSRLSFGFSSGEKVKCLEKTSEVFTIPVFRTLRDDEMVSQYEKEKELIKKIYKGRSMLEVTLLELAK